MASTVMFSYNQVSKGSKELADGLGIKRLKHEGSVWKPGPNKKIINWGSSTENFPAAYLTCQIINHPSKIDVTADKLRTFNKFMDNNVPHPEWTTSRSEALQWLDQGCMVFARKQLRSHSGRGIFIMDPDHPEDARNDNSVAPLYVKYVKKKNEYRVHVINNEIIDVQRKGLRSELRGNEGVNWKIQNLANGFVYVRNESDPVPSCVFDAALAAVSALELDFGAADVIYNAKEDKAYCLEVNSAPGLMGTTLTNYVNALSSMI